MFLGKRKNGIYFVNYFDEYENRSKRISTGSKTKREALKFLSELEKKISSQPKIKFKTLNNFQEEYVKFIEGTHSKSYLKSVKLSFRQFELYFKKDIPLFRISIHDTQSFITDTFQRAEFSARLYRRTLNAAFNRGVDWEYLVDNPFKKVKLGRAKKCFPVFINEAELNSILGVTTNKTFKDLFQTAFFTGMRLGELINLSWDNIDFEKKVIKIINDNNFNTKNKKDRIVPINQKLINILMERIPKIHSIADVNFVFKNSKGVKFNGDVISQGFKNAVREAGLNDKIHFHSLRHSFASNLVQKGVSLYVVKELLGHEDISTTQIYSHLNKESLYKAIQLL